MQKSFYWIKEKQSTANNNIKNIPWQWTKNLKKIIARFDANKLSLNLGKLVKKTKKQNKQ